MRSSSLRRVAVALLVVVVLGATAGSVAAVGTPSDDVDTLDEVELDVGPLNETGSDAGLGDTIDGTTDDLENATNETVGGAGSDDDGDDERGLGGAVDGLVGSASDHIEGATDETSDELGGLAADLGERLPVGVDAAGAGAGVVDLGDVGEAIAGPDGVATSATADAVLVGMLGATTALGAAGGLAGGSATVGAAAGGAAAGGATAGGTGAAAGGSGAAAGGASGASSAASGSTAGWRSRIRSPLVGEALSRLRRLPWELLAVLKYSRYDDSDPLENERRAAVYETITAEPGRYLSAVSEASDVPLSTVRHHVRILEEERLVTSVKANGKRRYYPIGEDVDAEVRAVMAEPAKRDVLTALAELGPVPNGRLAEELDRDPSTVSHHLSSLSEDGLVSRERDGRATVNELTPIAREFVEPTTPEAREEDASKDEGSEERKPPCGADTEDREEEQPERTQRSLPADD
ncbi:helix-turn-helix domain-containing protein [Halobacteria archaeon AArc-dxtr1]|nr:helix-turn-helix domain-containing protein [Halobacteria archaeon AArc-dxtr1]